MVLFPLITLCHIPLVIWGFYLYRRRRSLGLAILIANIPAIAYNPLVLSISHLIAESFPSESVERFRAFPSALLLPLVIYAAFDMVRRTGLDWAQDRRVARALLVFAFVLVSIRLATLLITGGRTGQSFLFSLPLLAILSLTFIIAFGMILFRKSCGPWVAIGTVGMFFGMVAPAKLFGPGVEALSGVLFAFCLLWTERRLQGAAVMEVSAQ